MSRFAILARSLLLMITAVTGSAVPADQTVESLKARLATAPPDEQPGLCVQIAQHQLQAADKLYTAGDVEHGRAAVDDVATYAEKARDAAAHSRKHLKNTEIATRKMSEKLRDVQRTLNFEDQPPLAQAIQRLEDVRTDLLKQMFGKEKK